MSPRLCRLAAWAGLVPDYSDDPRRHTLQACTGTCGDHGARGRGEASLWWSSVATVVALPVLAVGAAGALLDPNAYRQTLVDVVRGVAQNMPSPGNTGNQ